MNVPRLVALNTQLQGLDFTVNRPVTVIGRSPECEILLDHLSVSRQHAQIEERGGLYVVRDLNSRNGIKIDDNPVRESPLNPGDVLTVGDVQLRFDAPVASGTVLPGAPERPLQAADMMGLARVAPGMAPGLPPGPGVEPETETPPIRLNLRLVLSVVIGLLLAVGLAVVIMREIESKKTAARGELPAVFVRVNENRWMRIAGRQRIRVEGKMIEPRLGDFSDNIHVSDDEVISAEKYDTGELLIRGLSGGNATVTLTMEGTGSIVVMKVLVRGRLEDPLEELIYAPLRPEDRRALAEQFVANGLAIERDRPFLAMELYRKALAVLEPDPAKTELYLRAEALLKAAEAEVQARWEKLRNNINVAALNNDRVRQLQLLEEAVKLIPDTNDPRHQKVRGRIQQLIQEQLQEKERRR